jgi:hypothetical protein
VAYDNARLCQALISSGRWTGDGAALETGLAMLEWLVGVQRSPTGRFAPVGNRGFLRKGSPAVTFDQQPLEAHATIAACLEALHATADPAWADRAWDAFDWFLGHNVVGLVLCDPAKGDQPYVNSMWEKQKEPYSGDAINAYNDGSPAPGEPPLGPFYELETSSPAASRLRSSKGRWSRSPD